MQLNFAALKRLNIVDFLKRRTTFDIFVYIALAAFTILIYVSGLFPETTVDSAKYAAVSRSIFDTGDFFHLKIHGEPYLQKPPLLFWLGTLFFRIFGISIVAFKLPTLLFNILGIYSTYRLGLLIYDKRTGLISALILTSSEALFLYSMDVHTDLLLTSNIVFGIWQLAEYLRKHKAINFILGFAGIGLAMISKGILGLAIPIFAIAGYLIVKRDFRTFFSPRWFLAIPILIIFLYPALKGSYDQFGLQGLKFYFWSNNIDRIRGDYSGGGHDYTFCLHTLAYIFMPWSLYTFSAFVRDWRILKNHRFVINNIHSVYCYSAIIIYLLIISVSSQQAPHYLLPVIPFIAIITAKFINDVSSTDLFPRTFRLMLVFRNLIVFLLWLLVIIVITYFFPTKNLLILLTLLFMFFLLVISFIRLKSKAEKLIIPPLIAILALGFTANTVYMPSALKYHGPIQASYLFNKLASDDAKLYTFNYYQFETYFYPKIVSEFIGKDQLKDIISKESCWIITDEQGFKEIKSNDDGSIISAQYIFPYKKLTNLSYRFLNPVTRKSDLSEIYLLKIR